MNYNIEKNDKYNSIEIVFDEKPSESVRAKLKANGFKWHRLRGLWYGYRITAEKIAAILDGEKAESKQASESKNGKTAEAIPEAAPEKIAKATPIKFYYNGIKLNGDSQLIKCGYGMNEDSSICLYIDKHSYHYGRLPQDIFEVKNNSNAYIDYFEEDSAIVDASHPLYRFIEYNAKKAIYIENKKTYNYYSKNADKLHYLSKSLKDYKKDIEEFEALEDVGQPSNADLLKVDEMNERKQAEKERQEAEKEAGRKQQRTEKNNFNKTAIREAQNLFPLTDNAKNYVVIEWSEDDALHSISVEALGDSAVKLSIAAADYLFYQVDERQHIERDKQDGIGYYDKTSFRIIKDGENVYGGRYDIGDADGGLVAHIKAFAEWNATHNPFGSPKDIKTQENEARLKFAEWLKTERDNAYPIKSVDSDSIE